MPTYLDPTRQQIQAENEALGFSLLHLRNRLVAAYAPLEAYNLARTGIVRVGTSDGVYQAINSDYIIIGDLSAGNVTVELPAASASSGRLFLLKVTGNTAGYTMTAQVLAGDTVDGLQTAVLEVNYSALLVFSDGSEWLVY